MFSKFDKDGSGTIDAEELKLLVRVFGFTKEHALDSLLEKYDTDGSGNISLAEFGDLVQSSAASAQCRHF